MQASSFLTQKPSFIAHFVLLCCFHVAIYLNFYDENLCCLRWRQSYFEANVRLLNKEAQHSHDNSIASSQLIEQDTAIVPMTVGNTVQKRFRQAKVLTDQLADIISYSTGAEFEEKMNYLRVIIENVQHSHSETLSDKEIDSDQTTKEALPPLALSPSVSPSPLSQAISPSPSTSMTITPDPDTVEHHSMPHITNLKTKIVCATKGRPKGAELTVIGLNKKNRKAKNKVEHQAFRKKHISEKKKIIMSWFVGMKIATDVLKGNRTKITTEDLIDFDPQRLVTCSQDEAVDIKIIRPFTTPSAYSKIQKAVSQSVDIHPTCGICLDGFEEKEVLQQCSSCLLQHHLQCIDLAIKIKSRLLVLQKMHNSATFN